MDRIASSLFYDRDIVGLEGGERRGHRGMPDHRFFVRDVPRKPHFLIRAAGHPWQFASVLFGLGFFAVFVRQADLIFQIVLGAPIFEEFVKFGLALLLSLAIGWVLSGFRMAGWQHPAWLTLRLPVALGVGAGFGVLEHFVTYSSEPLSSYIWRTIFHSAATGASMVAFQAALPATDLRARWLALAPSILVHYLNNFGAVALGLGSLALPILGDVATLLSNGLVTVLVATLILMLVAPRPTGEALQALAARLPVEEVLPSVHRSPARSD